MGEVKVKIDKKNWGDGPWQNEPDYLEWIDDYSGYECCVSRSPIQGFLCGYVIIKENHPLYGKLFHEVIDKFDVYGGLSFPSWMNCEEIQKGYWIFGFDCFHKDDLAPNPHTFTVNLTRFLEGENSKQIYRDFNFAKDECTKLAKQLKEIEMKGEI